MGETQTKRCARCREEKPRSQFLRQPRNTDGLGSYCKSCRTEHSREYRLKNAERINAQRRARRRHLTQIHRSDRQRINRLIAHFSGRRTWLKVLAEIVAWRGDATSLSYTSDHIDELIFEFAYSGEK